MDIHVLIVDDDEAIRESMCQLMENSDYRAFSVSNAEEALEFLKSTRVEIVITDIKMTGMDGLELTEQIKKAHDADVIVMTGYAGDYSYEEAIYKGASDFLFKPVRMEELRLRIKRVLSERKVTRQRDEMMEQLKKLAITDGLTNLYNLRYFYSQMEIEVDRAARYNQPLSLLLMDIDKLKPYNDTFGHIEGDKVLVRFGHIIRDCLRKMDSAYRYGGDEFTVILPSTKRDEAVVVADRIRFSVEKETFFPKAGEKSSLTISIGVAEFIPQEDLASFIKRADRTMYHSKKNGGNMVSAVLTDGVF